MRTILVNTALVMAVLLALAALFEVIAELDGTRGGYQAPQAILFAVLRLPQLGSEMLPIAALIGPLLGLGGLAAGSEIIVMRAAGLSVWRLASMVAVSGFILVIITGLVAEFIGPPLDYYARTMRAEARSQQADDRVGKGNAAWVKDGPVYMHLERVNSEYQFGSIYLFRFDKSNKLESIARASSSNIDENDQWILEDYVETRFFDDGVQAAESSLAVRSFNISPEMLGISLVKPLSLSGQGLLTYISYLQENELDSSAYETELWYRISRTATVMVMPVLGLAFVFGSLRTGGTGGRLMIGVVIGLAYNLAGDMLANSGRVFELNPAIVAWLPTAVLIAVTVFALNRAR
jgi:lipopolysaccharide export system permease protein